MKYYVAYHPDSGKVAQTGSVDDDLWDHLAKSLSGLKLLNVRVHYTKPNSIRVSGGKVVPLQQPAAKPEDIAPLVHSAIAGELAASDRTQIQDFPIDEAMREAWRSYRQKLRRLSDIVDPTKMIRAWPERPDGKDPIAHLRARITGEV